ncbi:DUF2497 domain-containing protein [Ancylobacter moscoviensis]
MSVSARANEPSMEEILASIRRIISDEVAVEPASPQPSPAQPEPRSAPRDAFAPREPLAGRSSTSGRESSAIGAPDPSTRLFAPVAVRSPVSEPAFSPPPRPVRSAPAPISSMRPAMPLTSVPLPPVSTPFPSAPSEDRRESTGFVRPDSAPAVDPFAPRARSASTASALHAVSWPERAAPLAEVSPSVPESDDLDTPLGSALFDLALVEQAVQAELAHVSAEAAASRFSPLPPRGAETAAPVADADAAALAVPVGSTLVEETIEMQAKSEAAARSVLDEAEVIATTPTRETPVPFPPRTTAPSRLETRPVEPRFGAASRPATGAEPAATEATRERLVSGSASNAVSAAFGSLQRTVTSNSRTVDDLVTEAIRPMLKAWLDENLPTLVERLVRAEIERVARQGQ